MATGLFKEEHVSNNMNNLYSRLFQGIALLFHNWLLVGRHSHKYEIMMVTLIGPSHWELDAQFHCSIKNKKI
jgi:hypothetical protein